MVDMYKGKYLYGYFFLIELEIFDIYSWWGGGVSRRVFLIKVVYDMGGLGVGNFLGVRMGLFCLLGMVVVCMLFYEYWGCGCLWVIVWDIEVIC